MDPGKAQREDEEFRNNPFFAASLNAMEKLRWDFENARTAQMEQAQQAMQ